MITIIILPVGIIQKRLSDIYFLGSLLDKKYLEHDLKDLYTLFEGVKKGGVELPLDNQSILSDKRIDFRTKRDLFLENSSEFLVIDSIIGTEKIFPDMIKKEYVYSEPDNTYSEISGKAKDRIVLFKPPFPDYKVAVSAHYKDNMPISFNVKLRLVITENGTVSVADALETSGYPDIDLIAIRYVKKWKFIPLKPDQAQEDQEGMVQIRFGT